MEREEIVLGDDLFRGRSERSTWMECEAASVRADVDGAEAQKGTLARNPSAIPALMSGPKPKSTVP